MEENKNLIAVVLLFLAVFAAYLNTLPNDFIFDDKHMIVHNNYIKNVQFIPLFFKDRITSEPIAKGMWRPLLMLTFMFNYFIGGLKPQGYHLVNIFIHFLNAVLLYFFLKLFLKDLSFALRLGISLIFCLHPVNTEAVAYISSRSDLLCSFFILSSLYAYIRSQEGNSFLRRQFLFLLSLGLYVLALLSKESGLVFLGLLFVYEWFYPHKTLGNSQGSPFPDTRIPYPVSRNSILRLAPFLLVTVGYLFLQKVIFGSVFGLFAKVKPHVPPVRPLSANILTQAAVSFFYLYLFFYPFNLCLDHNFPIITSFANPLGSVSLVLIVVLVAFSLFLRKRAGAIVGFACLWYFISLSPKFYARLNLVAAEHQAYLAYFALYFLLGFLFTCLRIKRIYLRQLFLFVLGLFFILTLVRNFQWREEFIFWRATLKSNPNSGIAKGNLGFLLQTRGEFAKAEELLKDAAANAPLEYTRINSLLNLVNHYALHGSPEKGMEVLMQKRDYLLKKYPLGFYKSLGCIYMQMKEKEKAKEAWERALIVSPGNSRVEALLGMLYLEQFLDRNQAAKYFKESVKHDPDSALAYLGLAQISEKDGDLKTAVSHYQKVVKAAPRNPLGYFFLGLVYAKKLSSPRAEYYFKKAIEVSPDFAPAYYNLCVFYLSLPEPDFGRAQEYFDKARQLGYETDPQVEEMLQSQEITQIRDCYSSLGIGMGE